MRVRIVFGLYSCSFVGKGLREMLSAFFRIARNLSASPRSHIYRTPTFRNFGDTLLEHWLCPHIPTSKMLSSSFSDAPVSRSLAYLLVGASILASITDTKHYFYIQVDPHLWRYHQLWRLLTYQLCYTNSTEVLFAAMTLYNMRVIERLWGSRKYAVCK
jgi:membrane associated rhomboid family serine protease